MEYNLSRRILPAIALSGMATLATNAQGTCPELKEGADYVQAPSTYEISCEFGDKFGDLFRKNENFNLYTCQSPTSYMDPSSVGGRGLEDYNFNNLEAKLDDNGNLLIKSYRRRFNDEERFSDIFFRMENSEGGRSYALSEDGDITQYDVGNYITNASFVNDNIDLSKLNIVSLHPISPIGGSVVDSGSYNSISGNFSIPKEILEGYDKIRVSYGAPEGSGVNGCWTLPVVDEPPEPPKPPINPTPVPAIGPLGIAILAGGLGLAGAVGSRRKK